MALEVERVRVESTLAAAAKLGVDPRHAARLIASAAGGADIADELRRAVAIRENAQAVLVDLPNAARAVADDLAGQQGLDVAAAEAVVAKIAEAVKPAVAAQRAGWERPYDPGGAA